MQATAKRMSTEARREHLLAFGRAHFAEHGYDAMPMDAIAQRAGVSKGLLYHYFGDQRAFYMETIRAVTDDVIEVTEPPVALAFEGAFRVMVTSFVEYVADNASIYRALVRGGLGSDADVNALLERVRMTNIDRILARLGVDAPSPRTQIAIYGWISFVENASAEWVEHREVHSAALIDLFVSAFSIVIDTLSAEECAQLGEP